MKKDEFYFQFLLEQFKALRQEIDNTVKQIRQVIYLNVLGFGAIWYLILTKEDVTPILALKKLLYWTPTVISAFCTIYIIVLKSDVNRVGKFLEKTEVEALETRKELGWEHYLASINMKGIKSSFKLEIMLCVLFAIINLIGTLISIQA